MQKLTQGEKQRDALKRSMRMALLRLNASKYNELRRCRNEYSGHLRIHFDDEVIVIGDKKLMDNFVIISMYGLIK